MIRINVNIRKNNDPYCKKCNFIDFGGKCNEEEMVGTYGNQKKCSSM